MNYIDNLNAVPVSTNDLLRAAEDTAALDPSDRSCFEVLAITVGKHFKNQPRKAGAVFFRMEALARLVSEEGAPGWTLPRQPDGSIPTQHAVFAAAAVEPLVIRDERATFERERFLAKVLELAEPEGNV